MRDMLKKTGAFLLVTVMLISVLTPLTAMAAKSGKCGDNLTWKLDDSWTLTISGTGDMWDWGLFSSAPWYSSRPSVKKVVIKTGVTSIGSFAFTDCNDLSTIEIPSSVTEIGEGAFSDCDGLADIYYSGSEAMWNSISGIANAGIPYGATIHYNFGATTGTWNCGAGVTATLDSNGKLTVSGMGAMDNLTNASYKPWNNVSSSIKSVVISEGVTHIGSFAFSELDNLITVTLPTSLTYIGASAFYGCNSLGTITIPKSLTYLGSFAFSGCDKLTAINYGGNSTEWKSIEGYNNIPSSARVFAEVLPTGTLVGYALRTDIKAEINGHTIPSYNVNNLTYIVAEDLREYGFSVSYDDATRMLTIVPDAAKNTVTKYYTKPYVPANEVGVVEHNLLATDIKTNIENNIVASYNINGQTIIQFNELGRYGGVSYDDSKRLISVTLPWIK